MRAVALSLALAATLAVAGGPTSAPTSTEGIAAEPAPLADTPETVAVADASCAEVESAAELFTPVDRSTAVQSDDMPAASAKPRRGFCRCSCSFVPDCSTSADCGGAPCLKGPTCC
jgi:hypothetical protein